MMSKITLFSLTIFSLISCTTTYGDIGGNRIIANAPGRCWRVTHRDFDVKGNLESAYIFKLTSVGGDGSTDDILTYELVVKQNYVPEIGWDESKTKTYTGGGLIKSISGGRVRFEIYVDIGNGVTETFQGYYHPGASMTDFDDRIVIGLTESLMGVDVPDLTEDCLNEEPEIFAEVSDSTN